MAWVSMTEHFLYLISNLDKCTLKENLFSDELSEMCGNVHVCKLTKPLTLSAL